MIKELLLLFIKVFTVALALDLSFMAFLMIQMKINKRHSKPEPREVPWSKAD